VSEASLPLPRVDAGNEPFWRACAEHRLRAQRCRDCRTWRWPPSGVCPNCHSWSVEWEDISGAGTVVSFVVVHRAFGRARIDEVPYVVAHVALAGTDQRVVIVSNVVGCSPAAVHIGMPVRVVFDDVTDEVAVPRFRPDDGPSTEDPA
jgi:uncharacterized OB-fold protein